MWNKNYTRGPRKRRQSNPHGPDPIREEIAALKFYDIERQYVRALAEARREGRKEDEQLILARLNEMKIN